MTMTRTISIFFALAASIAAAFPAAAQSASDLSQARTFTSFSQTGAAALAVTTSTARVQLGSNAPVAWVCNTGTSVAYVALGSVTVVATVAAGFPVLANQCAALNATGAGYIAAITSTSTAALAVATGFGRP